MCFKKTLYLYDWDLVIVEVIWLYWNLFHVEETSLGSSELWNMARYPVEVIKTVVISITQVGCGTVDTNGSQACREYITAPLHLQLSGWSHT